MKYAKTPFSFSLMVGGLFCCFPLEEKRTKPKINNNKIFPLQVEYFTM